MGRCEEGARIRARSCVIQVRILDSRRPQVEAGDSRGEAVGTQSAPGVGPWLKSSSGRSDAPLRLFVFPYAGGAPSAFRTWPDALAPRVEPHVVALPGREKRFHETPIMRS